MKKLIFLLLFAPLVSETQIVINKTFNSFNTSTTNVTGVGVVNTTFTAGRLYLFFSATTGTTNPGTITSTSLTWDNVINTGNSTRRIQVFRCVPSSTVTLETAQIGTFGGGSTGYANAIWEITGFDPSGTNGSGAIIQAVADGATGADPVITMAALLNGRSSVVSMFFNDRNGFAGTEESGWTEDFDNGYSTPDAGTYVMSRLNTVDNTPTVTSSSSTWIGVAIELRASGRRAVVIN